LSFLIVFLKGKGVIDKADTTYDVETPEGIVLHIRVAGITCRASAYSIDVMIRAVVNTVVSVAMGLVMGETGMGLMLIFMFLNEWFYPVYFEVCRKGQTPGKKAMKLRVINGDGTPVNFQSSVIRNLLIVVDMLPLCFGFGIISCLMDKRFRRLGDLAAGTVVIYEKEVSKVALPEGTPIFPPVSLTVDEQKAVIAFAERRKMLSTSRQSELAEILKDVHGQSKSKSIEVVQSYALALAGKT
jgi:uncharacterized RDD family membrane protein YckC